MSRSAPDPAPTARPTLGHRLTVRLVRGYLRLVLRTTRWHFDVHPDAVPLMTGADGRGGIIAFWHESLAIIPALRARAARINRALRVHVMISRNRDGRLITDIVMPWNMLTIAGSTAKRGKDKGGAKALRQAVEAVSAGDLIAITPDGPSGPAHRAHPGTMTIARLANAPVVPVGTSCIGVRAPSWDRLRLPLPWGRGRIVCGAPLPPDADNATLENALNDVSERAQRDDPSVLHAVWGGIGWVLAPFLIALVHRRLARGKEIADRRLERIGLSTLPRPDGRLIWLHGASVGETMSLLPVMRAILARTDTVTILMTTATVTAADLVAREAAQHDGRLLHQFIPFDVTRWVTRFLRHWRPEAAVFVESELWPTMIRQAARRGVRLGLLNARMSERSWRTWRRAPALAARIFRSFDWIAARSPEDARRLRDLGAQRVEEHGDLKQAAPMLAADPVALETIGAAIRGRPLWLAASTHEGEEGVVVEAARLVRQTYPTLLTIVAPRHPERGAALAAEFGNAPRRALGQLPGPEDAVWIFDTLGEMGLAYRLGDIVFLGNSLPVSQGGGHNPFEPARLGCALATGSKTGNFNAVFADFGTAVARTDDAASLAAWVHAMLGDPALRAAQSTDARTVTERPDDIVHHFATRLCTV